MELSNESYVKRIENLYSNLANKNNEFDIVSPISSVPASTRLEEAGNYLHVVDGVLYALPVRYGKHVMKYCEANGLVDTAKVSNEVENEVVKSVAEEDATLTADLVTEL